MNVQSGMFFHLSLYPSGFLFPIYPNAIMSLIIFMQFWFVEDFIYFES